MKIRKINILLAVSLVALIAFFGCKKDDGAIRSSVTIASVPTITTNIDPTGSQAIDLLNLASFSGKFTVALYFSGSNYSGTTPPTKIDVVVRKNGSNANVKVYKAGVTTLPASYTVTAAEISTLFGAAIALGDTYDFAPDIYVGDKKYEAFPATGIGTGTWSGTAPGFGEYARFAAICKYDPDLYTGPFKATDAFGDANNAILVLTKVDNTHFSFIYPSVLNPVPIVVTVNTGNNNVSVTPAPVTIGTQWSPNPPYNYPNTPTYANPSVNSATGTVAPCDKTVTLKIQWGTNNGSLQFSGGPYTLVLTKQ